MTSTGDPAQWWRLFVDAIAAFQRGDKEPARVYLRFVEAQRGREVAEETVKRIKEYAKHPAYANCAAWKRNGYVPVRD